MAKIRDDLIGVVSVAGLVLHPGDEVPAGVVIGKHVLAEEEPAKEKQPRKPRSRKPEE